MGDTIVVRARDNYVALVSGARIGRYVVRSVLGQGSFGITDSAHDGQLGCDVAIKEYLPMALAVRHDGVIVVPNSTERSPRSCLRPRTFDRRGTYACRLSRQARHGPRL